MPAIDGESGGSANTQVVLTGPSGEIEPSNFPDDVGLTLCEGTPPMKERE